MFCYWYFLSVCCLQLFNVLFEEKNAVLYSFIVFQRRRGVVFRFLRGAIRCTQTSRCYARRRYIRAHSCVFIAQQISFMTGERVAASKYSFALCCAASARRGAIRTYSRNSRSCSDGLPLNATVSTRPNATDILDTINLFVRECVSVHA